MREQEFLDVLKETNLNVHRALFVKLNSRWNFTSNGSPYTRLYFISDGKGFLKTNDQYVELLPGNVYFIPSDCKFSCGCEHLEKIFFHIDVSTVEKYDLFFNRKRIYSLPCSKELTDSIRGILNSENYIDILNLKKVLLDTVINFSKTYAFENLSVKKYSELTQNVISFIENNATIKLTVSDISKALFISESKIRNAFKDEMKIPIGKYIDDMVFIKARRLLIEHGSTISSVSSELGFCDQFYFSRRFKEKLGITPSEFKKANK